MAETLDVPTIHLDTTTENLFGMPHNVVLFNPDF
jgi:hypothetical protein